MAQGPMRLTDPLSDKGRESFRLRVREAFDQLGRGEVEDRGTFEQYLEDDPAELASEIDRLEAEIEEHLDENAVVRGYVSRLYDVLLTLGIQRIVPPVDRVFFEEVRASVSEDSDFDEDRYSSRLDEIDA